MCILTLVGDSELLKTVLLSFVLPLFVGFLSFIATYKYSEWQKRKSQSLLGVAVIDSLIEEAANGLAVLEQISTMLYGGVHQGLLPLMPRKSWNGMQTIPDDVLVRILCVSKGKATKGFPAKEIRIHLKNYFDHMCVNIDRVIDAINSNTNWQPEAQRFLGVGKYAEAAQGVLEMLKNVKRMLEANSHAWFPK